MTDRNTCTCRGYAAMHKPHPHADRDGSECQSMAQHFGIPQDRWDRGIEDIRARMEREHERALAAYVPEDEPGEVERLRAELVKADAKNERIWRWFETDAAAIRSKVAQAEARVAAATHGLDRLIESIEADESQDPTFCHDYDRTDAGECALVADLKQVRDALACPDVEAAS